MIADPIFQVYHLIPVLAIGASALVGWMTLTGSLVAMFKLKGDSQFHLLKNGLDSQHGA